jgi:hypothetical protein
MPDLWVLDASGSLDPPCFCPYDPDTNEVVVGMNVLAHHSPGRLIGVFHPDGQEAVEEWRLDHPDWQVRYA